MGKDRPIPLMPSPAEPWFMRRAPGPVIVDVSSLIVARRVGERPGSASTRRLEWRDRMGRGSWTAMDMGYILALFAIVTLNLLDITITLIHTGMHGWETEGNPLIRFIAENVGVAVVVVFKLALVGVALVIMWYVYRRARHAIAVARDRSLHRQAFLVQSVVATATLVLVAFYVWVVQHNVGVVWG